MFQTLEDLDFAGDFTLALLSSQQPANNASENWWSSETSSQVWIKVSNPKTKVMRVNDLQPITIGDEELQDVNQFSYLGTQIDSLSAESGHRISSAER